MEATGNSVNVECIENELEWLQNRIDGLLDHTNLPLSLTETNETSSYTKFLRDYKLSESDRVFLILAFAAHFKPSVLTRFILASTEPGKAVLFGGSLKKDGTAFTPTVRTALYLLCEDDTELLSFYAGIYNRRHRLFNSGILILSEIKEKNSFTECELLFNDQFSNCILHGQAPQLEGDAGFPARRSKSMHKLNEVVLHENTLASLDKIRRFARNMKSLWELPDRRKYRDNFLCIFSGDPGTGKSHTAEAIGNELNLPVYKINFAQLVSKYIGETEKNLERVFDRFSGHPSILFFDEAESIFSKRTEVKDSHDKHANNEQSFLLQKIEEYDGIVILATNVQNLSQYFDKAFQRRIRQIVMFEFPEYAERQKLWNNALGSSFMYEEGLVEKLAKNYQLTGGGIYNVISEGVIEALDRKINLITFETLEPALKEEFRKTGRRCEICTDEMVKQDPVRRYGPGYEQRKNF